VTASRPRRPTRSTILAVLVLVALVPLPVLAQDAVVPSEETSSLKDRYPYVRFSVLGGFEVPALGDSVFDLSPHAATPGRGDLHLPANVEALDGRQASVRGFMLPLETAGGRVTRFILTATLDACHFGTIGQANEWILVTMAQGRDVPFPKLTPITVFGRLAIRPRTRAGRLAGLYEMTADAIAVH
jgi:hypothetical protein